MILDRKEIGRKHSSLGSGAHTYQMRDKLEVFWGILARAGQACASWDDRV
jgi:hypothetical protein